jgi:hypothetical protein
MSKPNSKSQVALLTKRLEKLEKLRPETKAHYVNSPSYNANVTGQVYPLTNIAEGVGQNQRTGLSVQPTKLHVNYYAAQGTNHAMLRVFILTDLQQQPDTIPLMSDVLQAYTSPINSFYSKSEKHRFKILYDHTHVMTVGEEAHTEKVSLTLNISGLGPSTFNGVAAGDLQKNHYYLAFINDQVLNPPSYIFSSLYEYNDL